RRSEGGFGVGRGRRGHRHAFTPRTPRASRVMCGVAFRHGRRSRRRAAARPSTARRGAGGAGSRRPEVAGPGDNCILHAHGRRSPAMTRAAMGPGRPSLFAPGPPKNVKIATATPTPERMSDPLPLPQVPEPKPEDPEDVSWALSTAEAMWAR